jgi:hypothetical protein
VQCAWAAVKKKDSYLQAQFYRIKARRGPKKAIMAVIASILTAIYHMLKDGTMYKDLGRAASCSLKGRPVSAEQRPAASSESDSTMPSGSCLPHASLNRNSISRIASVRPSGCP